MPTRFEKHLAEYSTYSDVIKNIDETDFSNFNPSKGDSNLVWDKSKHVGVMNRHNYALLFWIDYFLSSNTKPVLIHVDRHDDLNEPEMPDTSKMKNPEYAAKYIDNIEVNQFMKPSIELGLFESIELRGHSRNENFSDIDNLLQIAKNNSVVFDLDLDVYERNPLLKKNYSGDAHRKLGLNFEDSYTKFAEMIYLSDLTTVAFSPHYVDNGQMIQKHFNNIRKAYSEVSNSGGIVNTIKGIF